MRPIFMVESMGSIRRVEMISCRLKVRTLAQARIMYVYAVFARLQSFSLKRNRQAVIRFRKDR